MLSFIFLVFCASDNLQEFPSQVSGVKCYWQKAPPAAALAKTENAAISYFNCLKEDIKTGVLEERNIGEYGQVTGKTHQGGALLTVTGYKVFVANFTFEKVLASHIKALIANYLELSKHVGANAVSTTTKTTAASDTAQTLTNTSPGTTPNFDTSTTTAVANTDSKAKDESAAIQQRHADIQSLGLGALQQAEANDFLARLGKLDAVKQQQFKNEWATTGDKIARIYGAISTTERDELFSLCPTQFHSKKEKTAPTFSTSSLTVGGRKAVDVTLAALENGKKPAAKQTDMTHQQQKVANQNLAYAAIDGEQGSNDRKVAAKAKYDQEVTAGKTALLAFVEMNKLWTSYRSSSNKAYPTIKAPKFI